MLDDLLTNQYLAHFLSSPSTVATLLALGLLAGVIALLVRRRRLLVLLTGLSAAAIGGLTLAPARGWTTLVINTDPWAAITTALRPGVDDLWAWSVTDGPSNVALFVPFALFLTLLLRRPGWAFATSAVLSLAVESYQAATGTRVGVFADVVSNSLGAAVGAVLATVVLTVVTASTPSPELTPAEAPGRGRVGAAAKR